MDTCHYCHEPITRHESSTDVMDWDEQGDRQDRIYHEHCHTLDIHAHRERGDRLPEDRPLSPSSSTAATV